MYAGLFMGQTSLVFAGLQCLTLPSLVGGLTVWLSGGLSLTGLGLCVWALLARRGKMDLKVYHGGYERSPVLATCFFDLWPGQLRLSRHTRLHRSRPIAPGHNPGIPNHRCADSGRHRLKWHNRHAHLLFTVLRLEPQACASQSLRPREKMAMLVLLAILLGFGLRPTSCWAHDWKPAAEF